MGLTSYVSIFLLAWLLLYAIGYYVFLSSSASSPMSIAIQTTASFVQKDNSQPVAPLSSPFISTDCPTEYPSATDGYRVGAIIYCRNCDIPKLTAAVRSLLYDEKRVSSIVITDDHSLAPLSSSLFGDAHVQVLSSSSHIGLMRSYINAVKHFSEAKFDALLFASPTAIAAPGYLTPLLHTLYNNPNSFVYPSLSYYDDKQEYSSRDHLLKIGFDAALNDIPMRADSLADESISVAFAGDFFLTTPTFLHDIGGFHTELSPYNSGNIEVSIRAWLCGGGVIFSPCSHVKVAKVDGAFDMSQAGYMQYHADADAFLISRLYFPEILRESIMNARFSQHLPVVTQSPLDAVEPTSWALAGFSLSKCKPIEWLFDNVYRDFKSTYAHVSPVDPESIIRNNQAVQALLLQYNKPSDASRFTSEVAEAANDKTEADKLAAMRVEHHTSRVRDELLCEDYSASECSGAANRGACKNDPGFMMFHCPKSCNFCGTDHLLCIDFYLNKCPVKAAEGECDTNREWMQENCRQSCRLCAREGSGDKKPLVLKVAPKSVENNVRIDPYVAQQQWKDGLLPDPTTKNTCELRGSDHAKILNRINLHQPLFAAGDVPADVSEQHVRLFCGSYTMEESHQTNVQTLRSSWGKRCDGYVAFSTATDESIPAIAIAHEGPESYNNMWQKSKSIWKYIAKMYMEEFDYFLLGGDDMYYVIENLQAYLTSNQDIVSATARNEGLYIGRRFYPGGGKVFNSGGAGYILNRAALKVLGDHIEDKECFPHQQGFWEDVNVANCLKVKGGIEPMDTRDDQKRERFHPFTPALHYQYRIPPKNPDWYAKYNPELGIGLECCSVESISFHYAKDAFMKQMHSYLYHCDNKG